MTSVFLFKAKSGPGQDRSCEACTLKIRPRQKAVKIKYVRHLTPKTEGAKGRTVYYHARCFRNEPTPGRRPAAK